MAEDAIWPVYSPRRIARRQDQTVTVEGLSGIHSVTDNILVYGEGDTEE